MIWSSVHGLVTLPQRPAHLARQPPDASFELLLTMFVNELEAPR
ncbi:MAG: hypothetical protein R2704_11920 [Microthrixaceae bacterium]